MRRSYFITSIDFSGFKYVLKYRKQQVIKLHEKEN
jgi:hypothetical protein